MKAIIAFALLCIVATQALKLGDISAYQLGFSENFGLTESQIRHGSNCFYSFNVIFEKAKGILRDTEPSYVNLYLVKLAIEAEGLLKSTCKLYLQDIASTIVKKANGTDLNWLVYNSTTEYRLEIIRQFTLLVTAFESGDLYHAGNMTATLVQYFFGFEKPERPPVPEFNYFDYDYKPIDFDNLDFSGTAFQFFSGVYETLGFHDHPITNVTSECTSTYVHAILVQTRKIAAAKTQVEKLRAWLDWAKEMSIVYEKCGESLKLHYEDLLLPLIEVFRNDPVKNGWQLIKNIGLNLPEIKQLQLELNVDSLKGEHFAAGEKRAQILLLLLEGLF